MTKSAEDLGHVVDVILDVESHSVLQYKVSSGVISKDELLISRDQVASITEERMEVYDTALPKKEKKGKDILPHLQEPEGAVMREV